jgi:glucose-1-phosphate adenylyltransferase
MGADYYESSDEAQVNTQATDYIPLGIGEGSIIRGAIIDKNAHIGAGVQIVNKERIEDADRENLGYIIRSGIVVIVKGAIIPDGTII